MKTAEHPTLPWKLTFDPTSHTYRDQENRDYESVTHLVGRHFPAFDEVATSARVAARTGRIEKDLVSEWNDKRDAASDYGHRVHAYAESLILGTGTVQPETDNERRAFAIVDKALAGLAGEFDILAAEQIVFDPLFLVAGTIDLVARRRSSGELAVLDWKTNDSITLDAYGRTGLPPIAHVSDCKVNRYALQLSTYAWMLTDAGHSAYPSKGEPVELALIHVPHVGADPVWRPVPHMPDEVGAVMDKVLAEHEDWDF